ncbi:MAG: putative transposase [Acetobacteraceae bacterium]|jgi:putative transposase|nr:putative transposase [Acetobacteraceae bacterium]
MAAVKAFFQSAKTVTDVTPDQVTTDGHDSYPRAIRTTLGEAVLHRISRYPNN